jgi:AcrR family transcriptional regulator
MFKLRRTEAMNYAVTSKQEILKQCRDIVSEQGLKAVNMRSVAKACNVALGSLYNYFPNKDDLVIAVIESVWQDIFHMDQCSGTGLPFPEYVQGIFESVKRSAKEYPQFLTAHSLSLASEGKNKARDMMEHYLSHMRMGMLNVLHNDASVRKDAFGQGFSEQALVGFVLGNIMMLLMQNAGDCSVLIEMLKRSIY